MLGIIGLQYHPSRHVSAAGSAGNLSQKLKGPFTGTKIRKTQGQVGTDYSHQSYIGKIMTFGDHLGTHKNIDGFVINPFQQGQNGALAGGRVAIHPGNPGLRKEIAHGGFHFFSPQSQMLHAC